MDLEATVGVEVTEALLVPAVRRVWVTALLQAEATVAILGEVILGEVMLGEVRAKEKLNQQKCKL